MLAWLRGATVEDGTACPTEGFVPDADDPTVACGPNDPTAPAVVAVLRASAEATVKRVASSTTPRRARPPAGLVLFQRVILMTVLLLFPADCGRSPLRGRPRLRISQPVPPTPELGHVLHSAGGRCAGTVRSVGKSAVRRLVIEALGRRRLGPEVDGGPPASDAHVQNLGDACADISDTGVSHA